MRGRNGDDPVNLNLSLANVDNVDAVSDPSDSFIDPLSSRALRLLPEDPVGVPEGDAWLCSRSSSATARK